MPLGTIGVDSLGNRRRAGTFIRFSLFHLNVSLRFFKAVGRLEHESQAVPATSINYRAKEG
jgi:hypothetical protein